MLQEKTRNNTSDCTELAPEPPPAVPHALLSQLPLAMQKPKVVL
jgi:hypothetical protein